MIKFTTPTGTLPTPTVPRRYFIMGATSLPDGTAFAVRESQRHLLTEFAMGQLSVEEVVAHFTAVSATAPTVAAIR